MTLPHIKRDVMMVRFLKDIFVICRVKGMESSLFLIHHNNW